MSYRSVTVVVTVEEKATSVLGMKYRYDMRRPETGRDTEERVECDVKETKEMGDAFRRRSHKRRA